MREVSRRTSKPPEQKGRVSRPDISGKRDLDERIVEDRADPVLKWPRRLPVDPREDYHREAIERDHYLGQLVPTEGGK